VIANAPRFSSSDQSVPYPSAPPATSMWATFDVSRPLNAGALPAVPDEGVGCRVSGVGYLVLCESVELSLYANHRPWHPSPYDPPSPSAILPALPAAASSRAAIVDARRMGRGEGRRDDSTWLAHLAPPRHARETLGGAVPFGHDPHRVVDRDGAGLLLPLHTLPGADQWVRPGGHAAIPAPRAALPARDSRSWPTASTASVAP